MKEEDEKPDTNEETGKETNSKDEVDESTKEKNNVQAAEKKDKSDVDRIEKRETRGETEKKVDVDKELLQVIYHGNLLLFFSDPYQ